MASMAGSKGGLPEKIKKILIKDKKASTKNNFCQKNQKKMETNNA